MTIMPTGPTPLAARSDADFSQPFLFYDDAAQTQPMDLTDWTFRFVVKRDSLDAEDWIVAEDAEITIEANSVTAFIERETLAEALEGDEKRVEAEYALQATGPSDLDAVFAAGKFTLVRGL